MRPRLVAVAHGTRNPHGPHVIELMMRRVRRRLADVDVVTSYVELVEPSLVEVLRKAEGPSVVVPLLLSTGYHISHDLPEAARQSPHPVVVARPLGPHPLLGVAMGLQLRAAGARRGDAVVMVAAGSTDPDALVDTHAASRLLESHWGSPVRVAHLTGGGRRIDVVMQSFRDDGHRRVAVAPYLLAPGYFANRARAFAQINGACAVSDVLGHQPLVGELVLRRYAAAARGRTTDPSRRSRVA